MGLNNNKKVNFIIIVLAYAISLFTIAELVKFINVNCCGVRHKICVWFNIVKPYGLKKDKLWRYNIILPFLLKEFNPENLYANPDPIVTYAF